MRRVRGARLVRIWVMARTPKSAHFSRRSISEAVEAATAGADRSAHLVSISRLADILGRDRGTLADWIAKGCPAAKTGASGEATLVDPAAVVAWREKWVRDDEARKYARPDAIDDGGGTPMKPADLLKLEQIKLTRLKDRTAGRDPHSSRPRRGGVRASARPHPPGRHVRSRTTDP